MKNKLILTAAVLLATFVFLPAQSAGDIVGKWLNADKDAHIQISREGNQFVGKIVWLKEPIDPETGKPKVDKNNPEEKLRTRKTLGLTILSGFTFEDGEWSGGTIYDPKSGNTYKSYITLAHSDKMNVRGYIGKSWMGLGRTTEWTRVKN
jgi:uncharacterized protein (DUF2147 family)